jgi:hypothetical protein
VSYDYVIGNYYKVLFHILNQLNLEENPAIYCKLNYYRQFSSIFKIGKYCNKLTKNNINNGKRQIYYRLISDC